MKTDNQTIAEFMGAELVPKVYPEDRQIIKTEEHGNWYLDDLKYETSWDWLMPACKKWDELPLLENSQYVALSQKLDDEVSCYEIEPAYRQLVYNLKWYNTQPK